MRVGLISDTHGLLRPEALAALAGSDLILHAGDVGTPAVLDGLRALAPVVAVRGNVDAAAWARGLPEVATVPLGRHRLLLLHDAKALALDPAREGYAAVVAGHSHRPSHALRDGVHFVNPGSAGPRRFRLPVAVARLVVADAIAVELVELVAPPR